jgi:antitoxin component YwqK of YwqJK toxin-antitoxin module
MNKNFLLLALCGIYCLACKPQDSKNSAKAEKQYIYYENGAIRREFNVIDGKREGLVIDFYPSGKRKIECMMLHDKQVGKTTVYFEDGITIREVQYYDQKGNRERGDTIWYANGNIEFIAQFANNKKNGALEKYDTTGILIYSALFKDDNLVKVLNESGIKQQK